MKGGSAAITAVNEPYAQALLSLGQSNNLLGDFSNDVALILETLDQSEDLKLFLANPFFNEDAKKSALSQLFGGKVNDLILSFMKLLVDRRRAVCMTGICREFQAQVRKLNQIVLAQVTSTVELSDAQKQNIRDRVMAMTNAQSVELETRTDASLLGGVIIKVGSQVIDASLSGQLRRISYKLAGVN